MIVQEKALGVALALLVACSSDRTEIGDASVNRDRGATDSSISFDAGLAACLRECSTPIPCFSSEQLCKGNCETFFAGGFKQSPACGACIVRLFEMRACPERYGAALFECDVCEMECAAGQIVCGNKECVDPTTDDHNCGKCGVVCDQKGGFICADGQCVCPVGLTACDSRCTSTQTDYQNCGRCGHVCGNGCAGGNCCPAPKKVCSNACVDTASDDSHCGDCGISCDATVGFSCEGGSCQCTGGNTDCDGVCVDTKNDHGHCGSCDCACAEGELCVAGTCGSCP